MFVLLLACTAEFQDREIDSFTRVETKGDLDVHWSEGPEPYARVICDAEYIDTVKVDNDGDTLKIDVDGEPAGCEVWLENDRCVEQLKLSAQGNFYASGDCSLDKIELKGSGDVRLSGFESSELEIKVKDSGDVRVFDLRAEEVRVETESSGRVQLDGRCEELEVHLRDSGDLDAQGLIAEEVEVDMDDAADATVHASEEVHGQVKGSGDLFVYGDPVDVDVDLQGSGTLELF